MDAPLGTLVQAAVRPDTTLYVYRPRRRVLRGVAYLTAAALLVTGAVAVGVRLDSWFGWLIAIVPVLLAAVAVTGGLTDLIRRSLFQIEVNHRARTLALAMGTVHGEALAKVGFKDVVSVSVTERVAPLPAWNVTLELKDGRRIGLGLSDQRAVADETAMRFAEMIGVEIRRST